MLNIVKILGKQWLDYKEIDPYGWFQLYFSYFTGWRKENQ